MEIRNQGAVKALIDVYQKEILKLQLLIKNIDSDRLISVMDHETINPDCESIQSILTHVVSSGFSYAVYIQNSRGILSSRPERKERLTAEEFIEDLNRVIDFTNESFASIYDDEIEKFNDNEKIFTRWGQLYDIEQLMEHAIVHILRHRRQIEGFVSDNNAHL